MSLARTLALAKMARDATAARAAAEEAESLDVNDLLFEAQKACLAAVGESKRHAVCTPRRAGKTNFNVAALFYFGLTYGIDVCYAGLTAAAAVETIWEPAKGLGIVELAERIGADVDRSRHIVTLANGGRIFVRGVLDLRNAARFRGKSFGLVIVDECQDIPPELLNSFIKKIITPCLADNGAGTLVLSGTPSEFQSGLFYEICVKGEPDEYVVHKWSWEDNPHVRDHVRVEAEKQRKAHGDDDPVYLREYCGMWVPDKGSMCAPNFRARLYPEGQLYRPDMLPPIERLWYSLIGIDVGGGGKDDPSVVLRLSVFRDDPKSYVTGIKTIRDGAGKVSHEQILEAASELSQGWKVTAASIDATIAFAPAPGRAFPIDPANKLEKAQQIAQIDDELFRMVLLIPEGSELAIELATVYWDPRAMARHKKVPTSAVPNDHFDALQYAHHRLVNMQKLPAPPPTPQETMLARQALGRKQAAKGWRHQLLSSRRN